MNNTAYKSSLVQCLLSLIGRCYFLLTGWRTEGTLPDVPKYVILGAPHTSNWDFLVGMSLAFVYRLDFRWIGKREIFRAPFGPLLRWLGGISIDRRQSGHVVAEVVRAMQQEQTFILAIAPEGTRKTVVRWKSGFYYIALGAGVPILCGFFDYGRKVAGFGPLLHPTGNYDVDLQAIQAFYASIHGKRV